MTEEENTVSPMCGEEAFLLLLFIVERQLFPQEGSAKSIFSISVICFSSTAPEELPLYLLFCPCGRRGADILNQRSEHSMVRGFFTLSNLSQIKAFRSCNAAPKICTHRDPQYLVRVQLWRK